MVTFSHSSSDLSVIFPSWASVSPPPKSAAPTATTPAPPIATENGRLR